jgi:hypothetical protein
MQSDRFRPLLTAHGPYGSVYFDDSHDTEDAAKQIELKWREMREQLEQQGAEQAIVENLERAINDTHPPVGKSGRAIVASADEVLLNEHLTHPAATPVARLSTMPYIIPVVEYGLELSPYVVVAVDHAGGDITLHRDGRTEAKEVDGGGYPVHHAKSAESPGYGDPQRTTENAVFQNLRAVGEELTKFVDECRPSVVFIVGEVESRTDFKTVLPERVMELVKEVEVGARHSYDEGELRHEIDQEFQRRRVAAIDDAAQRFQAEINRDSGFATEGLAGVTAALRFRAVDTLIIGDLGDETVVAGDELSMVAPNPDVLSEFGTAPTQVLRADEALPLAAVAAGASLVRTDERLDPAEGVGAVLRFPIRY